MDRSMSADVVHDVEFILRRFIYTDAQIAAVWEQQLILNQLADGERVAEPKAALAYLRQLMDTRVREPSWSNSISNRIERWERPA